MQGAAAGTRKGLRFLLVVVATVALVLGAAVMSSIWRDRAFPTPSPPAVAALDKDDDDRKPDSRSSLQVTTDKAGDPVIRMDEAARRKAGLASAPLEHLTYQPEVRGYGTVIDLDALTTLHTNYVTALAQRGVARARIAASKPAYDRAASLYGERTGTVSTVQTTEAAWRADEASLAAADAQVSALSASAYEEWGLVIGKAIVQNGPLIERLIHRDRLLVQITLRPGVSLAPPPTAALQVQSSAPRVVAQFVSNATQADPRIQGLSFYYDTASDAGLLPNMNVIAMLANGAPGAAIRVPKSAVVWWAGKPWIYLATDRGDYVRRTIPADAPTLADGAFVVPTTVARDIAPAVVVTGAQALLSEEFRAQIQLSGDND